MGTGTLIKECPVTGCGGDLEVMVNHHDGWLTVECTHCGFETETEDVS